MVLPSGRGKWARNRPLQVWHAQALSEGTGRDGLKELGDISDGTSSQLRRLFDKGANRMPSIVPRFEHNVFVSYARVDNVVADTNSTGWVASFTRELRVLLDRKLGRSSLAGVWEDRRLPGNAPVTPEIETAVRRSATLLIILSPGYLVSQWCQRELDWFLDQASRLAAVDGRIFVIRVDEIPRDEWPEALRDLTGYQFYETDCVRGHTTRLFAPRPFTSDHPYEREIVRLHLDLAHQLMEMKRQAARVNSPAAESKSFDRRQTDRLEFRIATGSEPPLLHDLPVGSGVDTQSTARSQDAPGPALPGRNELLEGFRRVSRILNSQSVPETDWIPRVAEAELAECATDSSHRLICLTGPPGSGKTALLAACAVRFAADGHAVLAIKVDLAVSDADFEETLAQAIGVNSAATAAIRKVAENSRTIVVLDQMDALAGLVDLTSDRLNQVMTFIDSCLSIDNVWVICSCREFEFLHDVRLTVLDPKVIPLPLPEWDQIVPQLERHGISGANGWPPAFREVLRTPQHLSVFLRHIEGTGSSDIFESYQHMLDTMWRRCVQTEEQREFLDRLTDNLTHQECLWAPVARFEADSNIIDSLAAVRILKREGPKVGFHHQTLLEHARARMFIRSHGSFAEHVLSRQHTIHVRPTVWAVLAYLRVADSDRYEKELISLLAHPIRLHLRYLLIDFLGSQQEPNDTEVTLLAERLQNIDERIRILLAIRGSAAWFGHLKDTHLVLAMHWPGAAWAMMDVIASAWEYARDDCLLLIQNHWMHEPQYREMAARTLMSLGAWDERAVAIVCRLVRQGEQASWSIQSLASIVSADKPELAPKIVREALLQSAAHDLQVNPIESIRDWYGLSEIAEAAPMEFVNEVWTSLVELADRVQQTPASPLLNKYDGAGALLVEGDIEKPLLQAMRLALEKAADTNAADLLEVLRSSWNTENGLVQSLIVIALTHAAATSASAALEYLQGDPRRMMLGNYETGYQACSRKLISAIAPHLTLHERNDLEQTILEWSEYRPGVEPEGPQIQWDRQARLRLLRAIPEELLADQTAEFARQEELAVPDWEDHGHGPAGMRLVREIPPMSREEMVDASDDAIVDALSGPFDRSSSPSEWLESEDEYVTPGGGYSGARELSALARTDPDRVISILLKLMSRGREAPVATVLHDLHESPLSDDDLFGLIMKLSEGRTPSEDFRSGASYSLYKRCAARNGLTDEICQLLATWLGMPWDSSYGKESCSSEEDQRGNDRPPQPILWHPDNSLLACDRSFWTLLAVTSGYLGRRTSRFDHWFDILESHIPRDISERTWRSYCIALRWIALDGANHQRGEAILTRLLERFPGIVSSGEGVRLIATVAHVLSPGFLKGCCEELRETDTKWGAQALGELLAAIDLRNTNHEWAMSELIRHLDLSNGCMTEQDEALRIGIAFTAAELWDVRAFRPRAVELLAKVAPECSERIALAFSSVFWANETFPDDEQTLKLLGIIQTFPSVLHPQHVADLVSHLAVLCRFQRGTVCQIIGTIVRLAAEEGGELQSSLYSAAADFVNIATTLQRWSDTREAGMNILESLMRMGVGEANRLLDDIDMRPVSRQQPPPPKRRRRRRRR